MGNAMNTENTDQYLPTKVVIKDNQVIVSLADGNVVSNPLDWHPWLKDADPKKLENVELSLFSVWWPDLDEGLDIEGMMRNIPSGLRKSKQFSVSTNIGVYTSGLEIRLHQSSVPSFSVSGYETENDAAVVSLQLQNSSKNTVNLTPFTKTGTSIKTITVKEWVQL